MVQYISDHFRHVQSISGDRFPAAVPDWSLRIFSVFVLLRVSYQVLKSKKLFKKLLGLKNHQIYHVDYQLRVFL